MLFGHSHAYQVTFRIIQLAMKLDDEPVLTRAGRMAFTRWRSLDHYMIKTECKGGSEKKNEKESSSGGSSDKKNETESSSHGSSEKKNETKSGSSSENKQKEIISYAGPFKASGPMSMRAVRLVQNARQRAASV